MSPSPLSAAVRRLGRGAKAPDDEVADAELLRRFVATRDEPAFEELLRRHGPTVLGVCRRRLGNSHDADDAFQAVFLILARRADAVRDPRSLGNWLYGVALRTATKAKAMAAKRTQRLKTHGKSEAIDDPAEREELLRILDEEIAKLPEQYRIAIVVCDLNGKSRSVAARELGWPEGTLSTRLTKARELLAARLRHRGVTLSAAALAAALASAAEANVSPTLTDLTLAAATTLRATSPAIHVLVEGVIRSMKINALKLMLAIAVSVAALGGALLSAQPAPAEPEKPVVLKPAEPAPPAKADEKAEVWKEARTLELTGWLPGSVAYSPDGKMIVVGGSNGHVRAFDAASGKQMWEHHDGDHFAAVAFSKGILEKNDGEILAITFKNGVRLLNPITGKSIEVVGERDSKPIAVGVFPEKLSNDVKATTISRKIVLGNARGYSVINGVAATKGGTLSMRPLNDDNKPEDDWAVPLAVDPRGKCVILEVPRDRGGFGKKTLWAWSAWSNDASERLEGHTHLITAAAWSADGMTAVTSDVSGRIIIWNTETWKEKSRIHFERRVAALAINRDGSRIAAAIVATVDDKTVRGPDYRERVYVWEPSRGSKVPEPLISEDKLLGGPFVGLAGLAFSPDGKSLAAGFCNFALQTKLGELVGKVRVWALDPSKQPQPAKPAEQKWEERIAVTDHDELVTAVAVSPNGFRLASAGADGTVHVRNAKTLKTIFTVKGAPDAAIAFSRDNSLLAVGIANGFAIYSAIDGKLFGGERSAKFHVKALSFSPDGKELASNDGKTATVTFIPAILGRVLPPAPNAIDEPLATGRGGAAFLKTSRTIAYLGSSKIGHAVRFWSPGKSTDAEPLSGHKAAVQCFAVSPDESVIATGGSDAHVVIHDVKTAKELRRVKLGGRNGNSTIHAVAFSPDGKTLAASVQFEDGKGVLRIVFIDVATGIEVGFKIHGSVPASLLAYSKDGLTLFAAYGWENPEAKPLTLAERKAAGGILVLDLVEK